MPRSPGRSGSRWRRARQLLLVPGVCCWLCGQPIDLSIRWNPRCPDPGYGTLDHLRPLARGGAPLDLRNLRPAHYGCNSRRGALMRRRVLRTSRQW